MRKILVLLFFIAAFQNISFGQDTINWKTDYKLKWQDFQGAADAASPHSALTHYTISYRYSYVGTTLQFTVSCYFDKPQSWKKTNIDDPLLAHEQGHFDIAEITAKRLAKAFAAYKLAPATVDADIKNIYQATMNDGYAMQDKYDNETDHSRNKQQQEAWLKTIKSQLQ